MQVANQTPTGTTVNLLAKLTSTGAIKATISDTNVPVFIVEAGAGTTGNAEIAVIGNGNCIMDTTTSNTEGFYVIASVTTDGRCHAQSTAPTAWILGTMVSNSTTTGSAAIVHVLNTFNIAGAGSGTVTSIATTAPIGGGIITSSGTITCTICTTSAAALTDLSPVLGSGGGQGTKTVAGLTTDGVSIGIFGVAGTSVGGIDLKNATSGTISVRPVTGALGSVTLSAPARTATLATNTGTLTNGNLESFDSSGNGIDSGVVAANAVTAAANYTNANLVQAAGANKTTSDSGIATANVVTAASAAAAANKVAVSAGANKVLSYIDFPDPKIIPAANCVNAVAGSGWSAPSTFTPTCRAGTNNLNGVLNGVPSTGATGYFDFELSGDWDTAVKPYISVYYGSGANTSGTVIWTISTACTKQDGSVTDDPAWIAESAMATQTMAVANRMWAQNAQLAGAMTNCVVGSTMYVKLALSGTATSAIQVSKAVITVPRLLTVQAN
jgi:hypothetical protein